MKLLSKNTYRLTALLVLLVASVLIIRQQRNTPYQHDTGIIFGTIYNITYQSDRNLKTEIEQELHKVDNSLSTFNKNSVISAVNQNRETSLDEMFVQVFNMAQQVSADTDGDFDITVAPLVNAWGFGFKNNVMPAPHAIDSIMQIVGYTKDEIRHYFADYLKYSASVRKSKAIEQVTKEDVEDLLNELASMYDGYCFDKRCMTHVYSTWSIISFFKNRFAEFENYWYVNGGLPSVLQSYISDVKDLAQDILKSNLVTVDISTFLNPTNLDTMDIRVLLYQTGYLTLDKTDADTFYLKFPNQEIIDSFKTLYFGRVFNDTNKRSVLKSCKIDTLTTSRDIVDYFNRILNAVDYEHYPLTQESAVTNSLFMFFNSYSLTYTNVNVHSSKGRADLIIDDSKRRIVCELKYAKESDNAEVLLKEACAQIAIREYGETEPQPQDILKLALVFSEKERKFTLYKEC